MNNKINLRYLERKWHQKRTFFHLKLGISMMLQIPLLNIFLLPIIMLTMLIWLKMDLVFVILDIPELILPICSITIKTLGIIMPLLFLWGLIDMIGSLFARKDEANIQMAFNEKELRNGSPILMYKRKDKKNGVTIREFYSPIPMKLWVAHQEEISDAMNVYIVQDFSYGGKSDSNRIVMHTISGRKMTTRGDLYDDEF